MACGNRTATLSAGAMTTTVRCRRHPPVPLSTIRPICSARIILVFGCGGDRDQTKRRPMGEAACKLADLSIVTSDNPRGEDPQSIIDQIIPGFKKDNYRIVSERREAIGQALKEAKADDIVLIAGKGHETYQIFADERIDFNERKIIEEYCGSSA